MKFTDSTPKDELFNTLYVYHSGMYSDPNLHTRHGLHHTVCRHGSISLVLSVLSEIQLKDCKRENIFSNFMSEKRTAY